MESMADYPCMNCGWPAVLGKKYCETCDAAPFEDPERPWYVEYAEWVNREEGRCNDASSE